MKKFLFKFVLFLSLCAFVLCGSYAVYGIRLCTMSFAVPEDKTILFIGDSHVEVGADENIIPNSYNFAKSGDNYFNQFARLKKFLEDNPQTERVFISVSPVALNPYRSSVVGDYEMQNIVPNLFPLYGKEEIKLCILSAPIKLLKSTVWRPRTCAKGALANSSRIKLGLGGFKVNEKKNLEKDLENERDPKTKSRFRGDSKGHAMQIKYLRKIVELSREHGTRIIFLNPPLYKADEFFDVPYFESVLREHFSDVEFWDYANFPIPDNCFADINHVNYEGTEIFSKELARRIAEEKNSSSKSPQGK